MISRLANTVDKEALSKCVSCPNPPCPRLFRPRRHRHRRDPRHRPRLRRGCLPAPAPTCVLSHEPEGGAELSAERHPREPGRADFALSDVADAAALTALVTATAGRLGRLDCPINNAGRHPPHQPIDAFTSDEFESLMRLNVTSVFVGCRAAMPFLRRRAAASSTSPAWSPQSASTMRQRASHQGAVLWFTKALAVDEADRGSRVNARAHRATSRRRCAGSRPWTSHPIPRRNGGRWRQRPDGTAEKWAGYACSWPAQATFIMTVLITSFRVERKNPGCNGARHATDGRSSRLRMRGGT